MQIRLQVQNFSLCYFSFKYSQHRNMLTSMFTDLAEVMSVTPAAPAPGPPKKTDDKSFFDVSKLVLGTLMLHEVESFQN